MTDAARLRELVFNEVAHAVQADDLAQTHKSTDAIIDALKVENERLRAVVEAARAWGKTGLSNDQLQKAEDNLGRALAAMEQNDDA